MRSSDAAVLPARWRRITLVTLATLALTPANLAFQAETPSSLAAGATHDDLFALTNGDRSSNGRGALRDHPTLSAVGESAAYSGCPGAGTIQGRAQDMLNRNYFAHPIPPCGQYVFSIMHAYGINYLAAGENIGWESGAGDASAASRYINNEFMNSQEHRDNILNPNYTDVGIGSAVTPAGATWSGAGTGYQNVWMFSEEFAELGTPVTPPGNPAPAPPAPPPLNSPAPPPPAVPPVTTASPSPTGTPAPSATPAPGITAPGSSALPYVYAGQGLISDSVESVLESFLIN